MQSFLIRAAGVAIAVLTLDEVLKAFVRAQLAPCTGLSSAPASDSRSADRSARPHWQRRERSRFRPGSVGVADAGRRGCGAHPVVRTSPRQARLVGHQRRGLAAWRGVGQPARSTDAGRCDRHHLCRLGPGWNIADVALAVGAVLATWALVRRRRVAIDSRRARAMGEPRYVRHGAGQHATELPRGNSSD